MEDDRSGVSGGEPAPLVGRLVGQRVGPPVRRLVLRPPPPSPSGEASAGLVLQLVSTCGSLGSVALLATATRPSGSDGGRSSLAVATGLAVTLLLVVVHADRQRKRQRQRTLAARDAYLRYLATVREEVREVADRQRHGLSRRHPHPRALPLFVEVGTRVWERSPSDADFLHVRYGVGHHALALELVPPEPVQLADADPAAAAALRRLLATHRVQRDLPAALDLRAVGRIEVCGEPESSRALARALVSSATAVHGPGALAVAVLAPEDRLTHWEWVKWLPHAQSPNLTDAAGPARMVRASAPDLVRMLPNGARVDAHVLVVVDGADLTAAEAATLVGRPGRTLLDLSKQCSQRPDDTRLQMRIGPVPTGAPASPAATVPVQLLRRHHDPILASADQCDLATAEATARRLASRTPTPHRPAPGSANDPDAFLALLGLGDVDHLDLEDAWRPRRAGDRLRVPIGLGEHDAAVHVDLKESAQGGMGPHGLLVGATGSGKSELLRTLVLGLALTHSPEQLGMVLVDFKGGATFAGLSALPHVSALITNLADELALVDRMQDALGGELIRRQELLRAAGDQVSVRAYEEARSAGADLAPLPSLLVVVDEFSELLSARPDFADLFVAIGRLGRSLGLHLLLATQRLEEGRLRGLESHLSYRIALRTFSAAESRAVLGVPDAYELPALPGLALLQAGPAELVRFRAVHVSATAPAAATPAAPCRGRVDEGPSVLPFTAAEVPASGPSSREPARCPDQRPGACGPALVDRAVARLSGAVPGAHRIWLPPLDVAETLDDLMPDLVVDPQLGLVSPSWRSAGLVLPVGRVDRPREQRRDPLVVDLGGSAGHVAVVGGPRAGKSTLLGSIVAALCVTRTPVEAQLFVLDLGGGASSAWEALPHVTGVGSRSAPEVLRRIVEQARSVVDRREGWFRSAGIDSIATYRARRAEGLVDDGYGDVFLVVDGWGTLRSEHDELETAVQELAGRGLGYGLHVVAAATRWADFRPAMRDVLGTRLELRLGDPAESVVDRSAAPAVPSDRPGRGLLPGGLHFLAALPRIDGVRSTATLRDGADDLVTRVRTAWRGPEGPRLRLLPDLVDLDDARALAGAAGADPRVVLGLDEADLAPVVLDVAADPHLLLFGDRGSGKTATLRTYAREVVRARTSQEAQLVVVDYRRSLLGEIEDDHLLHHLTSAPETVTALTQLAAHLESRRPGPGVTVQELRLRSWWTGAEVFVIVDDYDLVAHGQQSPVALLQPLLPHARDVGLHLALARGSGGAARALYDPVIQGLRDLAQPGLLLSGDPQEGPLVGSVRTAPQPPGRGRLLTRGRGVQVVQTAWVAPRS